MLWESRFAVLFAVLASLFNSLTIFYMATVDAYYIINHLNKYASSALDTVAKNKLHNTTITHIIKIINNYLLTTILLIFSLKLYKLFISKIDKAGECETSSNVLLITNLNNLKKHLTKIILIILIIKFFEHAIGMEFKSPLDLLYLAGEINLLKLTLYLSHLNNHTNHTTTKKA